jgi:serine/threonine protein kinase
VLAPLSAFIDENVDPRQSYVDLQEIGAGGHGSVFTARPSVDALGISKHRHVDKSPSALAAIVAIKIIPVDPAGSPKIEQLKTELDIMRGIQNPHVLTLDMLFIDVVDDALWIRMEFMEWSLTDVIALADEGAEMSEAVIARFTADVSARLLSCRTIGSFTRLQALSALEYLKPMNIAHRDVRSDNMLINSAGVLKLGWYAVY